MKRAMSYKMTTRDWHLLIISFLIFLILDLIYLTTMKDLLVGQITAVQQTPPKVRLSGAILCYLLLFWALYCFVIQPGRSSLDGFYLGICIYGVYEAVNFATFKNWQVLTVVIDTLWGGAVFALTNYFTDLIDRKWD
jgi:uncharacterized membrane protein